MVQRAEQPEHGATLRSVDQQPSAGLGRQLGQVRQPAVGTMPLQQHPDGGKHHDLVERGEPAEARLLGDRAEPLRVGDPLPGYRCPAVSAYSRRRCFAGTAKGCTSARSAYPPPRSSRATFR
jgi:hypothetical protein